MKKNSLIILIVLFILIGIVIFYLPEIYNKVQSIESKKENYNIDVDIKEDKKEKKLVLDDAFINDLSFPIMRNNKNNLESYYQFDNIDINSFSNNDILYNAFLDIYDGYLVDHASAGCADNSKEFDVSYLTSRIRNIIGRDVKYTLEDFTVPNINGDTKYIGLWKYNENNNKYVYYGNCNSENNSVVYYDVKKLQSSSVSENNVYVYLDYVIYFVKAEGNQYVVYSDANMTNELLKGNINDYDNSSVNIDLSKLKKYRFTFKKGICTYDNYCFYKGEWIND